MNELDRDLIERLRAAGESEDRIAAFEKTLSQSVGDRNLDWFFGVLDEFGVLDKRDALREAVAAEREACAKIAESGVWDEEAKEWESSELIAAAIRKRGAI